MKKIDRGEVELITPEMAMLINTDKQVIFKELLGLYVSTQKEQKCLPKLVDNFFKGRVDYEFTKFDLQSLSETLGYSVFSNYSVKGGKYYHGKQAKLGHLKRIYQSDDLDPKCLVGASSIDNALWFHFVNDSSDVCNGSIYIRKSPTSKLVKINTFEINPFVLTGYPDAAAYSSTYIKPQKTWNPNWLDHTLLNMEKYVFSQLIA